MTTSTARVRVQQQRPDRTPPGQQPPSPEAPTSAPSGDRNPLAPVPTWDAATALVWATLVAFAFGVFGPTRAGARRARRLLPMVRRYLRAVLGLACVETLATATERAGHGGFSPRDERERVAGAVAGTVAHALAAACHGERPHPFAALVSAALGCDPWRVAENVTAFPREAADEARRALHLVNRAHRIARQLAPRTPRRPRPVEDTGATEAIDRAFAADLRAGLAAAVPHVEGATMELAHATAEAFGVPVWPMSPEVCQRVLGAAVRLRGGGYPPSAPGALAWMLASERAEDTAAVVAALTGAA